MNINLGMPQIIMIAIFSLNILVTAKHHGEQKNEKYNVLSAILGVALNIWILSAGGFFG